MEIEKEKFLDKMTELLKKSYTKELDFSKPIVVEKGLEFYKVEGK